ncbi:hypothetical protein GGQ67_004720 [Rhizobium metallidurans]|uniref:Uncharacterized protein n=1 Tax=Rhizobium metallidurans TaxID=1265931 RepID=A0A7W6CY69_9HYPH|nr:hypothetical protein [Rhizobium metallidurans]
MRLRGAASAVSRLFHSLDRLADIEPARALEGRDLPPLPSNSPLPAVRVETRSAFRAARRTLPRLPQTRRRGRVPCAAPSCFGHPLQARVLSCGALAVSSFACRRGPFPPVTVLSTAHDDGLLQHLSRSLSAHRAVPPARITGNEPVIAVALSGDSQQHRRLGHDAQTDFLRDGRIGYWYTNSRFARGARVAAAHPMPNSANVCGRIRSETECG